MLEKLTTGALALALLSACRPEPSTPESALMAAARAGRLDAIRALIKSGADVNRRGRNGWPPLVHAVHKRQLAAARLLLDSGARADEVMDGGATPLMFAAAYGDTAMVEELLSRGADPHRQAANGITALGNAAGGGPIFDPTDGPSLGFIQWFGGVQRERKHPPARIRAPPQVARVGMDPPLAAMTSGLQAVARPRPGRRPRRRSPAPSPPSTTR